MSYTISETWTLQTFLNDLRASNIRYISSPVERFVFGGASLQITNSDRLLLVFKNCITTTGGPYVLKSGFTGTEILSTLITQFGYTKVYLGHYATINADVVDLGGSKLQNISPPVNGTDASTKTYVDTSIATVNASITSANTTNQAYTDTKVNAQKARIDAMLEGTTTDLDQFKEIVSLVNSLDATQAQDILTKTSTLSTSLNSEILRATTAENALKKKLEFQIDVLPVPSVYADAEQPSVMPLSIKTNASFTGTDGFYFKNSTAGKKINWYLPSVTNLMGSDILNLYFDCTLFSTQSPPFISVYTQKTGTNDLGSWYHSKATYIVWDVSALSTYKDYQFYTHVPIDTPISGKVQYALTLDTSSSRGVVEPTDKILAISIGSNSTATQNDVEFVVDKCHLQTPNATFAYNFSSYLTEINALSSSATSGLSSLTSSLSAEVTRAQASETALSSTITSNYSTLNTAIVSEASLARTNETNLQSAVNSEVTRATAAEATINTKVSSLETKLDNLYQFLVNGNSSTALNR